MTFKLRHLTVLVLALFLGGTAMYMDIIPWVRVLVAGLLLFPIIYAAEGLGIAAMLNVLPDRKVRHRRSSVLRSCSFWTWFGGSTGSRSIWSDGCAMRTM